MEKLANQIGYLVLQDDGAVLESGGELENDERSASIFMDLLHLAESVDENFIPNSSCERISIVYEDHSYNICMSNRRIYIVKLRNASTRGAGTGAIGVNGSGIVYPDNENSVTTTIIA